MEVSARLLVAYGIGILTLITSGIVLVLAPLAGIALILAGLFAFPVTRRALGEAVDVQFSGWAVVFVVGILLGAGTAGVAVEYVGDTPDIWYEYEYEIFADNEMQPHIVITGEVENRGDGGFYGGVLSATIVNDNGDSITEFSKEISEIPSQTSQQFYFKSELDTDEVQSTDNVELEINMGD